LRNSTQALIEQTICCNDERMCGRYRRTTLEEELALRYNLPIPLERDLPISWNIAPTQDVLAIRLKPECDERIPEALRWG
jgi:putative SOS response-associated peptidase YedK